jgi:hypothetical protein
LHDFFSFSQSYVSLQQKQQKEKEIFFHKKKKRKNDRNKGTMPGHGGEDHYKITNFDEIHRGFFYKDGINELVHAKMNENPDVLEGQGLHFVSRKNVQHHTHMGVWLRKVSIPDKKPGESFHMVQLSNGSFRANKLTLGPRMWLTDCKDIVGNPELVEYLCRQESLGMRTVTSHPAMYGLVKPMSDAGFLLVAWSNEKKDLSLHADTYPDKEWKIVSPVMHTEISLRQINMEFKRHLSSVRSCIDPSENL